MLPAINESQQGIPLVTEKLINVGIFWLPFIAGIILSGLAPSIWYGGDKIAALWMTFAALVLLLLTVAFQIQSYIQANILQPQLALVSPEQKSMLTWNPPLDNSLNIKGENDNLQPGGWRVPTFTIKNTTPINAQDVSIKWSVTKYDVAAITANAPVFEGKQVIVANDDVLLAGGGIPFHNPMSFSATLDKPFITRSAETFIPLNVWNTAALYFLTKLPAQVGSRSEPYYFDVEISWSIPDNAKPARYRVKAVATRTKPLGDASPLFTATIEFWIESS